jgi:hypothetical protein
VGVAAGSGEVLSAVGELAAVQGVVLLLDAEEGFHGGDVVVLEDADAVSPTPYVFVTPSTFTFVFTVGRHLHSAGSTSRTSPAPTAGTPPSPSRVLPRERGTFTQRVEQFTAVVAPEGDEVVVGRVPAGECLGTQEPLVDLAGLDVVEVGDADCREEYVCWLVPSSGAYYCMMLIIIRI